MAEEAPGDEPGASFSLGKLPMQHGPEGATSVESVGEWDGEGPRLLPVVHVVIVILERDLTANLACREIARARGRTCFTGVNVHVRVVNIASLRVTTAHRA